MNTQITVLGATGKVGAIVTRHALAQGLDVVALVRDPSRLPADLAPGQANPRLTVVTGELDDPQAMARAVTGSHAVISVVGVRYRKSHPWGGIEGRTDVAPAAIRTLLAVTDHATAPRVVLLSAFGTGDTWQQLPKIARAIISSSSLKTAYQALTEAENLLAASAVPHTVVRAVTLTDAPGTGRSVDATGLPLRGNPKVTRQDVAELLLDTALAGAPASALVAAPAL